MTTRLSPRELETARLVADDLTDREIADIMGVSVHTIRAYLDRIFLKLNGQLNATKKLRRAIRLWVREHDANSRV